jgi:hypothetical protein
MVDCHLNVARGHDDKHKDCSCEDRELQPIEIIPHECGAHTHNAQADGSGGKYGRSLADYTDLFNFKGDHGEEFQDRTARSHAQTAVTGPRRACTAANRISDIR